MCLENGVTIVCADEGVLGGIKNIYLVGKDSVTSFTAGALHDYTAVAMSSTGAAYQFHKFEFLDETGALTWENTVNDNRTKPFATTVAATIPNMDRTKALQLQNLVNCCGVIAIVELYNDKAFVVGYDEKVGNKGTNGSVGGEAGPTLDDNNAYLLSLTGKQGEIPRQFVGTITITGGSTVTFAA